MSGDSSDKAKQKNISSGNGFRWWEGLLASFAAYVLSIAGTVIVAGFIDADSSFELAMLYGLSSLTLLGVAGLFLYVKKISVRKFLGSPKSVYVVLVPLFYVVYIVLSQIGRVLLSLDSDIDVTQRQDLGFQSVSGAGLIGAFVALVLIAPLAEEIVFRGLLYRSLRGPLGKIVAAVLVSILFGAAHGQWNVAMDTFVLSLVMIFMVEKSKSLWPAVALHMLKNLVAFLLVFVFRLS